jgi:hypothetical protein
MIMEEQELRKLWQESSNAKKINVDLNQLTMNLKIKVNQMDKRIKNRDTKEIAGCIIGIIFHVYLMIDLPYILPKIACMILVLWFGYVIFRLKQTSKTDDPDFLIPFKDQLKFKKTYLIKQMRLLDSVLYWYILPPFIANILFFFGLGMPEVIVWDSPFSDLFDFSLRAKIGATLFVALLYAYIYSQNKKAAKINYAPLIKEIDRLEKELEAE